MAGTERLWAPWRMAFIRKAERQRAALRRPRRTAKGEGEECLFCRLAARANDRADLVLARRPTALLMLNRFPYNPAHLMVAPLRHVGRFADLTPREREEVVELTGLAERGLEAEYRPHGLNYGANAGRVAGAGFPGHLHLHLVPRWNGDTNFMPVIGETKVLPESLGQTWTRLRRALRRLASGTESRAGRGRRR